MKRDSTPARGHFGVRGMVALAVSALMAISAACDDDNPMDVDNIVGSVEFTTEPQEIEIGSTGQLTFEIRDASGALLDPDDVNVTFSSSSEAVATVSTAGLVTPVAPGMATITIQAGNLSDTVTVTVVPEISSIVIADAELDLITDETLGFDVTVLDAEGEPVVDPVLTFTSSNTGIVSVDDEGNVTGISAGSATITVAGGGESDTIEVTVLAGTSDVLSLGGNSFTVQAGDAVTINELVTVLDAPGGAVIPDPDLVFTSTDPAVATVDATGVLSGLATGGTLITVTSPDAPTGTATFRLDVIEGASVDAFAVTPTIGTIVVDGTIDLGLAVEADGTPITNFLGVFSSSDPAVAVVDPFTGVVTGISPGVVTITVTNGALSSEAEITVE
jgi:uncharacterized protein YjdB